MENAEILGVILTLCGIVYIFLQGMGKLSDKGGEIETKLLSLKGGAGLVLVALGITIFAVGGSTGGLTNILSEVGIKSAPADIESSKGTGLVSSTPMPESTPLSGRTSATLVPTTSSSSSIISPTPAVPASKSVILEPIGKESGSVYDLGTGSGTWGDYTAGDEPYSYSKQVQTFLSFKIADIPANATINNATLDFSAYSRSGDPFSGLGCLGAYEQNFGAVDTSDFFIGTPTSAIARWCSDGELSEPSPSNELISVLQSNLGKSRFQIRVQFDKATNNDGKHDNIYFTPKLMVTYTTP